MPKFLKIPIDCPSAVDYIATGINAKGKPVYLCKYTRAPKNTVEVFAWLEGTPALAHRFKNSSVAKIAADECDMPVYNQPAEDVVEIVDVPRVFAEDWDRLVNSILKNHLEHIEVVDGP